MSKMRVETKINGEQMEFLCEPQQSMLDVLRDNLRLTGTKEGCATGDCGACSVLLDGRLVCSCLMLAVESGGRQITTIEGISRGEQLHPIQQKFLRARRAAVRHLHARFRRRGKGAARRESGSDRRRDPLSPGGQSLPLHRLRQDHPRGPRRRANVTRRGIVSEAREFKVVGTRVVRPDGVDKVTGRANFGADFTLAGHAVRQDAAQPARTRAHQDDRYERGRRDRRRVRHRDRRRLPEGRP